MYQFQQYLCYFVIDVVLVVIFLYLYKNGPQNVLYSIFYLLCFWSGGVAQCCGAVNQYYFSVMFFQ